MQRAGNLESDRNAASRKRQHDDIRTIRIFLESVSQHSASMFTISESS
jgi:hypothetical protein